MKLQIQIAATLLLIILFSCNRDTDSDMLPQITLNCSNITASTTLDVANYIVDCNIDVRNSAVLTIQPGTKFTFTENGSLSTSSGGAIKAIGTAEDQIVFTGKEAIKGFWKGININTNSLNNQFTQCVFEYGGNGQSMFMVGKVSGGATTAKAVFSNCAFRNSGSIGLYVNELSTIEGSADNTFLSNSTYPIHLAFENVSELNSTYTFTSNGINKVLVQNEDMNITKDVMLVKLPIPYLFNRSPTPKKRITKGFTIQPGVMIEMAPQMELEVMPSGFLNAVGTPTDPIIIRGQEQTINYWEKIRFSGTMSNNNRIIHCKVSDGGGYSNVGADRGLVTIYSVTGSESKIQIENSRFSNSGHYGIDLFNCSSSVVNGVSGNAAIKTALETANEFPAAGAADANTAGNVRTTN